MIYDTHCIAPITGQDRLNRDLPRFDKPTYTRPTYTYEPPVYEPPPSLIEPLKLKQPYDTRNDFIHFKPLKHHFDDNDLFKPKPLSNLLNNLNDNY